MIITLTQGKVAIVDDEDAELLAGYKWYTAKCWRTVYAMTTVRLENGLCTSLRMHRLIMGVADPHVEIDHIDGDGLNNSRTNLRLCSHMENTRNQGLSKRNTSGFKGVSWNSYCKKWAAHISTGSGRNEYLGLFSSAEAAHEAYCAAALKYHGKFANLG